MGKMIRMRWPGGKPKAFTTSYDDGRMEDFRLAEIMRRHGIRGTFNVCMGRLRPEGKPENPDKPFRRGMTLSELKEFYETYRDMAELASHGLTHPILQGLSPAEISFEITENRRRIEETFGVLCPGFAVPMTSRDREVILPYLKLAGTKYCRSTENTRDFKVPADFLTMSSTCHSDIPDLFEVGDAFLAIEDTFYKTDAALFSLWGHSFEFANTNTWDRIDSFFEKMGEQPDTWYATNGEICAYTLAYRSLEWSLDQSMCHNPTAETVWFRVFPTHKTKGSLYRVNPGETINLKGETVSNELL